MEFVEVSIPIPYGHLAAKWWGRQDIRPIVCLHGWQDNCGTFDTLIPLLPQHIGYLAIDLPGHGLSSYLPDGVVYSHVNYMCIVYHVFRTHFKWPKVSLIAHSMSGIIGFMLAALVPDYVDMVVSFEGLKPNVITEASVRTLVKSLNGNHIHTDASKSDHEPPSYCYEQLIEKMVSSSGGSVNREAAWHLLQRGSKRSERHPDRYYYSRDNRTKIFNRIALPLGVLLDLANRIRCPYIFFLGEQSSYSQPLDHIVAVMEAMRATNPCFEAFAIEGSHHLHLVEPTKVQKQVERFIYKYRPFNGESEEVKSKL